MFRKTFNNAEKREEVLECQKNGKGTLLLYSGFLFHVRSFGCVQNQVLNTYGKSAHSAQNVVHSKKLVSVIVGLFQLREKAPTQNNFSKIRKNAWNTLAPRFIHPILRRKNIENGTKLTTKCNQ